MAYFSNGTEGMVFDHQCSLCRYGEEACPIMAVQMDYNYEACNNPVARKILDYLVANDGTCAMWTSQGKRSRKNLLYSMKYSRKKEHSPVAVD
jgi:formate hydrogenlyase subunit 6/NADH:ubiquinone oxidoreductase subunit I